MAFCWSERESVVVGMPSWKCSSGGKKSMGGWGEFPVAQMRASMAVRLVVSLLSAKKWMVCGLR